MTYEVNDTGFSVPTGSELLAQLRDEFESRVNFTPDFDRDTFLGAFTAAVASMMAEQAEAAQQVYDQRSAQNASGKNLDDLVRLVGVTRQEATSSEVDLTLDGSKATTVPEGSVVEDEDGNRWVTQEDADLVSVGATFEATGIRAAAEQPGPIPAPSGTTWTIVTPVDGWDSAANPSDAILGSDRETDAELLERRDRSLQIGTTGTRAGIRAAMLSLDFVDQALVFDNPTDTTQTVQGRSMPPHSYAVVVHPTLSVQENIDKLAETLLSVAPVFIDGEGDESTTVQAADGEQKTVKWSYATAVAVNVDITYTISPSSDLSASDAETQLQDAVEQMIGQLSVGEDVKFFEVFRAVTNIESADQLDDVDITLDGGTANVEISASNVAEASVSFP